MVSLACGVFECQDNTSDLDSTFHIFLKKRVAETFEIDTPDGASIGMESFHQRYLGTDYLTGT